MPKKLWWLTFFALSFVLAAVPPALAAPPDAERYIVVLHEGAGPPAEVAAEVAQRTGGEVGFVYTTAIEGFSIQLPAQAINGIQHDPRIKYVATDDPVYLFEQSVPTGIQRIFADTNPALDIDGTDDLRVDVDVAVIDTGVDFQHPDLNVVGGVNCTGSIFRVSCKSGGDDDHYHGTHVAGTIAALDNGLGVVGVAPGARVWAVKVLNSQGSGYTSWIVAGIDWVAANADTIEVANMSLGGSGFNQAEYDAITRTVQKGVAFAVAAGNNDADAKNYSPATFDDIVLTVSALADFDGRKEGFGSPTCRADQDDTLADFSNWGPEIEIAAPGVCILSTYPLEQGEYGTISGTSMASPHVAGALALLASRTNPNDAAGVFNLYTHIKNSGNYDWTDDSGDNVKEPLLDIGNTSLFNPVLISGSPLPPPSGSITLAVRPYKVKAIQHADLTWSGATTTSVDVYRNGDIVATTENDGAYTDNIGVKTGGPYTYKVCTAGTTTCSNEVTITF